MSFSPSSSSSSRQTTATSTDNADAEDATGSSLRHPNRQPIPSRNENEEDDDDDDELAETQTVLKAAVSFAGMLRQKKTTTTTTTNTAAVLIQKRVPPISYHRNSNSTSTNKSKSMENNPQLLWENREQKQQPQSVAMAASSASLATSSTTAAASATSVVHKEHQAYYGGAIAATTKNKTKADQDGQGRKQDRRQNQEASSSNRSILARIEGMEAAQPPMELLSRQRAGLVRPHQPHGAFAIQHPDYDPGASQEQQQQQQHHRPSHSDRTTSRSSWMLPDRTDVARSSSTANTNLTSPGRGTTSTTASGTSSSTIPGMDPNTRLSQMLHAELVEVPIRASIFDIDADRLGVLHHERKRKHIRISLVVVLVVVVVVVLVIPLTIVTDRNKQHRREQFPYRCFTSTYDLLKWQIQDYRATNYTTTQNTYRMCPGTTIEIGRFFRSRYDHEITKDGTEKDYPITIIQPDTTIQCGSGQNENLKLKPCILDGGSRQVLLKPLVVPTSAEMNIVRTYFHQNLTVVPLREQNELVDSYGIGGRLFADPDFNMMTLKDWEFFFNKTYDLNYSNVSFVNLTFTGTIKNNGLLIGHSVLVNQPGDFTFDSCHWTDMIAPTGLARVTSTEWNTESDPLPPQSAQLSFYNCTFTDIEYNLPLLDNYNEILVIKDCTFANVSVTPFTQPGSCDSRYTEYGDDNCAYLMACIGYSSCSIESSCSLENVKVSSSIMQGAGNGWLYESIAATVDVDSNSSECGFTYQTMKLNSGNDPVFGEYDAGCYSSTLKLLRAQINDFLALPPQPQSYPLRRYVICPNTHIEIGLLEVFEDECYYDLDSNEDFPLIVIAPNTTIQCGFDGDVNNSCVLEGGTQQVYVSLDYELSLNKDSFTRLAGPQINPDMSVNKWNTFAEAVSHLHLDNVTIRGLTFSGSPESESYILGQSVYIRQPGNFLFEGCYWTQMNAPTGIIEVTTVLQNELYGIADPLQNQSTQLTIRNSVFNDLTYNHPIILVQNQILIVDNCTFGDNIDIAFNVKGSCELYTENPDWGDVGCSYVIACVGQSYCGIQQSCINDDVEFGDTDSWLYETNSSVVVIDNSSSECGFVV